MSITLSNSNNRLGLNYISAAGLLAVDNSGGVENNTNGISAGDLSSDLQTQISSIGTVSSSVSTLSSTVSTISSSVSSMSSAIAALQASPGGISLDTALSASVKMAAIPNQSFAKTWTEVNSDTPNMIDLCCSGDGQCALVGVFSVGSSTMTRDGGKSWFNPDPSRFMGYVYSAAMSFDGQYILVNDLGNLKLSTDNGQTFGYLSYPYPQNVSMFAVSVSATGKYMLVGCGNSNGIQSSSDYGATWFKTFTGFTWNTVCMALDGSVMYAASDSGVIKKSTDYGINWTQVYTGSTAFKYIACSGNGKTVLAAFDAAAQLFLSTDYGANFTSVGTSDTYSKVQVSANGAYMAATVLSYSSNAGKLYSSSDAGQNWSSILNRNFYAIAMSYNGQVMYNGYFGVKVIMSKGSDLVLQTAAPTIASAGSSYFDTGSNKLYVYNGSAWKSTTLS